MIISAKKGWLLKYIALVLLVSAVAIVQLAIDNHKLTQEVEHYQQLAIDNADNVTHWHQEALNWKTLFYHIPEQYRDWIIIGD